MINNDKQLPVVLHKAVAEVLKTERLGSLWERLVVVNQGWQSPLMDRKVVEVVCFWSCCNGCSWHLTTHAGCSVV